jgi:hypothetical protein
MPLTPGTSPKSTKTLAFQAVYSSAGGLASIAERLRKTAENGGFSAPARKTSAQQDRRVSVPAPRRKSSPAKRGRPRPVRRPQAGCRPARDPGNDGDPASAGGRCGRRAQHLDMNLRRWGRPRRSITGNTFGSKLSRVTSAGVRPGRRGACLAVRTPPARFFSEGRSQCITAFFLTADS